ncbi:MAG: efflux RND transporter periplasmic adaptor subunit [Acidaminococcaceae bacterium]|nr:efflux RND transporter periplasmic adaptor subunit [Acidaminococcaceae bacterium]
MFIQNRKLRILGIICLVLLVIMGWRIISNMIKARERAAMISLNRPIVVPLGHPVRASVVPTIKFSGTLEPDWQAQVAAKIDARLEKVFVREGDYVKKGQVLCRFEKVDSDADLMNARGAYQDAKANYEKAQLDFDRYKKLFEQGAISEQSLDNYRFALSNAEGKFKSARGTLQGMQSRFNETELTAPADGIVYKRYYQEGYYAKAATPVFAIADISKLKITIHIPEGNIRDVAVGNKAKIKIDAYPDKQIDGYITRIAPVADLPSHTFMAEVGVPNLENLKAGVYATVYLTGVPRENVLTIPPHALVMRDDQRTVYMVDESAVVTSKVIDIGYVDDQYIEVVNGLTEADVIVTGGQNKIREGNKVVLDNDENQKNGDTK